ncbi:MAG: hypothetical protein II949_08495 [Prevotella sp.]|nr:hypothetical protein [Prevotella sp.]
MFKRQTEPACSPVLRGANAASVGAGLVPARWPVKGQCQGTGDAASVGAGPVPARWPVKGQCIITILSDTGSIEPTGWHKGYG